MIRTPDRLADLRRRIESGEEITQAELNKVSLLQALDVACAGREFLAEAVKRQEVEDARVEQLVTRRGA